MRCQDSSVKIIIGGVIMTNNDSGLDYEESTDYSDALDTLVELDGDQGWTLWDLYSSAMSAKMLVDIYSIQYNERKSTANAIALFNAEEELDSYIEAIRSILPTGTSVNTVLETMLSKEIKHIARGHVKDILSQPPYSLIPYK